MKLDPPPRFDSVYFNNHPDRMEVNKMDKEKELTYPEHKHPHGVENLPDNEYRIWVCEECNHIFSDREAREGLEGWGHPCKSHPCRKGQRCESHLEPYIPELPTQIAKTKAHYEAEGHIKLPEGIEEDVAKWLFKNRHRLPNQRFYANWYDETSACPLTEKEYLNLTNEILSLIRQDKE